MADINAELAKVQALLREDKKQEADDLLQEIAAEQQRLADEAAGRPPAPRPPRAPQVVLHDILSEIVGLHGNKQSLLDKLAELKAVA
jgi:hypothetical protein